MMCGRYSVFGPVKFSRKAQNALAQLDLDLASELNQRDPQYNVALTQRAPVVIDTGQSLAVQACRWGLIPSWAKDAKIAAHTINARVETVASKPAFRAAFKRRRCLVPASGYFEWAGERGSKQPYFIHDPEGDILMFAGLWETWKDQAGGTVPTYTVLTGEPGRVSGDIHDRQPVILPPERWADWLHEDPATASAVLEDLPSASLTYHPVSRAVGNVRNHGAELVEPVQP